MTVGPIPSSIRKPAVSDLLLGVVAEVVGLLDLAEFRIGLLAALRHAVPADWISLNDIGPTPESTAVLVEPEFPPDAHALFARHALDNPLVARYQSTQDGRAYRFSDVCTPAELHATALYREFYALIGLEHQIAFTLPHPPNRLLAVALSRAGHDFSDDERDLLDRGRPFLIESYRNAIEHTLLVTELETRQQGLQLPLGDPSLAQALAARGVTSREAEVLSRLATGIPVGTVAELMGVSERTVQKHLQRCYRKLGVHSRVGAVALARSLASPRARGKLPSTKPSDPRCPPATVSPPKSVRRT